jgi:endonuclease I
VNKFKWTLPIIIMMMTGCTLSSIEGSSQTFSSEESTSVIVSSEISSNEESSSLIVSSETSSLEETSVSTSSQTDSSSSSSQIVSSSTTSEEGIVFPPITVVSNAPTYYNSISDSLTGSSLKSALKTLISKNVSVSYDWSRYEYIDQSLSNTSQVLTIYARYGYSKSAHVGSSAQANQWNREHTYPQSKISSPATSDNNHIFADDWKTNQIRGNKKFGLVQHIDSNKVVDSVGRTNGNFSNSTYFEPNDAAKGEVARATLYMDTMYGYSLSGNFQTAELAVMWALEYPVDDWAMTRNNRVFDKQKNRNPYIDNQTYICKVYGNTSPQTAELCAAYL